jgi:regulator of sigma E protease
VVETSWLRFLLFLAYISVTLAVLNILPIPVLDGGHLLFMLIEKVKGAPLKEETIGRMQLVGMLLLLVLMFFAFKNDLGFVTKSR